MARKTVDAKYIENEANRVREGESLPFFGDVEELRDFIIKSGGNPDNIMDVWRLGCINGMSIAACGTTANIKVTLKG